MTIPETIGPYKIIQNLGHGGMGEVFLALDPTVGRRVAIKRIRPELQNNLTIRRRFLREAKVASALTHPSIIPILEIQIKPPEIYYTMPFVEGETLRQILRRTRDQEKNGEPLDPVGGSIPALSRIFLQVCEAAAYTHSKGILHRDLKPENIIVGKYGEVMILDWGIADFIDSLESDEALPEAREGEEDLTRPGKITGTLAYMAPERLIGQSSSVQTDLYALGVILYQILTLQLPFQRKSIAAFRKSVDAEQLVGPIEASPYREIPHQLAAICSKCLVKSPAERFQSVEELLRELKKSIEGRPEWILAAEVDLRRKGDWRFQENVLLAKHLAISHNFDVTQWAALSISEKAFAGQIRIDAKVRISPRGEGIGFLLNIPAPGERENFLEEGYLLWISPSAAKLYRSNVQILERAIAPLGTLWHRVVVEKSDGHLKFYLDGELKCSFVSHLPLPGKHIGLLAKDDRHEIDSCKIYDGSRNVMVSCLAVPDAFLSHRLFDFALEEYRRIGGSFPGRMEGREALFRAGLALLEQGKAQRGAERERLLHLALKEFEKLYRTPGAPLEYLGKSFVYVAMGDSEEEAKCLELALRKFPKHPLLSVLKEHIVYRMHESSLNDREAAYRIILLAVRHIPDLLENPDTRELLASLKQNWESLPFIEEPENSTDIQLAFWLAKVPILIEMANHFAKEGEIQEIALCNSLHCLLELEANEEAAAIFQKIPSSALSPKRKKSLEIALAGDPKAIRKTFARAAELPERRSLSYLLRQSLRAGPPSKVAEILGALKLGEPPFVALELWSLLLEHKWKEATTFLAKLPPHLLKDENSPLHFPYGCFLYATQSPEAAFQHFGAVLDTPYPPTTALPSHFLTGRIDDKKGWIERAFWWEKKELYRQIDLFYKMIGKHGKAKTPD